MKKRFIVSAAILMVIAILGISTVFATDNEPITMDYAPIVDGEIATHAMTDVEEDTIKNESIYKAGEKIELNNELVNGSIYIAGNDVIIQNETVNGDVFVFANNVEVTSNTVINGNLYICAANVKLNATISRDLFCVAKDVVFEKTSDVEYDANIAAEHIYVNGTFRRNLNCSVSNIEVASDTAIIGELYYTSEKEAKIEENAVIGNVNFSKQVEDKENVLDIIVRYVLDFAKYFILTMAVLIILIKLLPKFMNNLKNQFRISSFGIGILSLIIVPVLLVLMLLLRVTSTLAFALLAIFIVVLMLSMAITNISLAKKLEEKKPNIKLSIWTAIVTAVTWIVYQIPVLGAIVAFIWVTIGLGMSVRYCFSKNK